jgi:hypothetical protein
VGSEGAKLQARCSRRHPFTAELRQCFSPGGQKRRSSVIKLARGWTTTVLVIANAPFAIEIDPTCYSTCRVLFAELPDRPNYSACTGFFLRSSQTDPTTQLIQSCFCRAPRETQLLSFYRVLRQTQPPSQWLILPAVKLTTHLQLKPRLRVCGATPTLPHMPL